MPVIHTNASRAFSAAARSATPASPVDFVQVEQDAYAVAMKMAPSDIATYLISTIGQRRAAAAVGLKDARPLKSWAEGGAVKEEAMARRLRVLFRITYAIERAYSAATAAAFLESTSPYLSDRSPLAVLATEGVSEAETAVVMAARALLEG
jgi:hypothetical protein